MTGWGSEGEGKVRDDTEIMNLGHWKKEIVVPSGEIRKFGGEIIGNENDFYFGNIGFGIHKGPPNSWDITM